MKIIPDFLRVDKSIKKMFTPKDTFNSGTMLINPESKLSERIKNMRLATFDEKRVETMLSSIEKLGPVGEQLTDDLKKVNLITGEDILVTVGSDKKDAIFLGIKPDGSACAVVFKEDGSVSQDISASSIEGLW